MSSAIQIHDELVARYREQRGVLLGEEPGVDYWPRPDAKNRNAGDPQREFDPILEAISSYLRPGDVLLDVGGGAGGLGLPLARRCKQLIIVDPSTGLRAEFEAVVATAGISNARYVQQDWLQADDIEGDVTLVAHVTYYIPDIRRFIDKLVEASRRRVILNLLNVPPPNLIAPLFEAIHGTPQALVPSHRELLPALWEMGILPDVQMISLPPRTNEQTVIPTRETAISLLASSMVPPVVPQDDPVRSRQMIDRLFDDIFVSVAGGFVLPRPSVTLQQMVITWETVQR